MCSFDMIREIVCPLKPNAAYFTFELFSRVVGSEMPNKVTGLGERLATVPTFGVPDRIVHVNLYANLW